MLTGGETQAAQWEQECHDATVCVGDCNVDCPPPPPPPPHAHTHPPCPTRGQHHQVSEALSHVLKRLRAAPTVRVPVAALVTLRDSPLVAARGGAPLNFINVFLGLGIDRLPPPEREAVLPLLLSGLDKFPANHRSLCLRLFVKVWCVGGSVCIWVCTFVCRGVHSSGVLEWSRVCVCVCGGGMCMQACSCG